MLIIFYKLIEELIRRRDCQAADCGKKICSLLGGRPSLAEFVKFICFPVLIIFALYHVFRIG